MKPISLADEIKERMKHVYASSVEYIVWTYLHRTATAVCLIAEARMRITEEDVEAAERVEQRLRAARVLGDNVSAHELAEHVETLATIVKKL